MARRLVGVLEEQQAVLARANLAEREAHPLHGAADDLATDLLRVDLLTNVVRRDHAQNVHLAGRLFHLDNGRLRGVSVSGAVAVLFLRHRLLGYLVRQRPRLGRHVDDGSGDADAFLRRAFSHFRQREDHLVGPILRPLGLEDITLHVQFVVVDAGPFRGLVNEFLLECLAAIYHGPAADQRLAFAGGGAVRVCLRRVLGDDIEQLGRDARGFGRELYDGGADGLSHVHHRSAHFHAPVRLQRKGRARVVHLALAGADILECRRHAPAHFPPRPLPLFVFRPNLAEHFFAGVQRADGADAGEQPLPADRVVAFYQHVLPAQLERVHVQLDGRFIQQLLHGDVGLVDPVAAEWARVRVVGERCQAVDAHVLAAVWPHGEHASLVNHARAVAAIGSRVGHELRVHRNDDTVLVQSHLVIVGERVALDRVVQVFLAGQGDLHGPLQVVGSHRRNRIAGHFQLAAVGAAHRGRNYPHLVAGHCQDIRNLLACLERALGRQLDNDAAVRSGLGQRGVRFQICVLDALRLEMAFHHQRRLGQRFIHVADVVVHLLADRAVGLDLRCAFLQRIHRVVDALQHLILYVHPLGCRFRLLLGFRHDQRNDVAGIADHFGTEHLLVSPRAPVRVQPGHVLGREHAHDARRLLRLRCIHPEDLRVGVLAPDDLPMHHAHPVQVVGKEQLAGYGLRAVRQNGGSAQAARTRLPFLEFFGILQPFRGKLHGLKNHYVPGATADVLIECFADLGLGGIRVPVEQHLGGQDHAGAAESALDGSRLEVRGLNRMQRAIFRRDSLDGLHADPPCIFHQEKARIDALAIDEHRAGAAIAGAAPLLCTNQIQFVAKEAKERGLGVNSAANGFAVHYHFNIKAFIFQHGISHPASRDAVK